MIEPAVIVSETERLKVDERWFVKARGAQPPLRRPLGNELLAHERPELRLRSPKAMAEPLERVGQQAKLGVPRSTFETKIRSLKIDKHEFKRMTHR